VEKHSSSSSTKKREKGRLHGNLGMGKELRRTEDFFQSKVSVFLGAGKKGLKIPPEKDSYFVGTIT